MPDSIFIKGGERPLSFVSTPFFVHSYFRTFAPIFHVRKLIIKNIFGNNKCFFTFVVEFITDLPMK